MPGLADAWWDIGKWACELVKASGGTPARDSGATAMALWKVVKGKEPKGPAAFSDVLQFTGGWDEAREETPTTAG